MKKQKKHACHHEHEHHEHNHHGSCWHSHNDSRMVVAMYFIGLILFGVYFLLDETKWISQVVIIAATLFAGFHIMVEGIKETVVNSIAKRRFLPNIHILMLFSAIGAIIIKEYKEAALLMLIFAGAHFLEHYVEGRSKKEINHLMRLNPKHARLIRVDGTINIVEVETLKVNDTIRILRGDQVAADGIILSGSTFIDESSINGESLQKEKQVGDLVFASTINHGESIDIKVLKENKDSVFSGILKLVKETTTNTSKVENKIRKFEPWYVIAVLILVPVFIVLMPHLTNWTLEHSFYRGMVLLTVASPCALAASAAPSTLSALSDLTKNGVLFKGGKYLSGLSDLKVIAFDKTGTLTKGEPSVTEVLFLKEEDYYVDLIVAMERKANHPLAKAILNHFSADKRLDIEVENVIGEGLMTTYNSKFYKLGKVPYNRKLTENELMFKERLEDEGQTVIALFENTQIVLMIGLLDIANEQSKKVIKYFKNQGIHTVMITGDSKKTGEAIARYLEIDEVFSNVMPKDKRDIILKLKTTYGDVAMVGDGVNDAPALASASIGVAMGEGTSVAIDVADAIIMKNDLTKFAYAHQKSIKLKKNIMQNIIFSMFIVVTLVIMNMFELMNLPIGVIVHEGSTIVVILNGLRLLKNNYKEQNYV